MADKNPEGSVRNIIILGQIGAGEAATIANRIVGSEKDIFGASPTEARDVLGTGNVVYNIKLIDTSELFSRKAYDLSAQGYLSGYFSEVHLVLFVLKIGPLNAEDKGILDRIFAHVEPCVKQISALLLIGCEGKDRKSREEVVKKFRDNDYTSYIADFMVQGIYDVGFLGTSEIKEDYKQPYEQSMREDEEKLRELVMKQKSPVEFGKMFKKKEEETEEPKIQETQCAALSGELQQLSQKHEVQTRELANKQARELQELAARIHARENDQQQQLQPPKNRNYNSCILT